MPSHSKTELRKLRSINQINKRLNPRFGDNTAYNESVTGSFLKVGQAFLTGNNKLATGFSAQASTCSSHVSFKSCSWRMALLWHHSRVYLNRDKACALHTESESLVTAENHP